MRVCVTLPLTAQHLARLRAGMTAELAIPAGGALRRSELDPVFPGCEIAFGNVPSSWLAAAGNSLRWLQLESVGFGEYLELDWATLGQRLVVTNLAGFFADPVAETALAGILALYRGIDRLGDLKRSRTWLGSKLRPELSLLTNRHLVLYGRGSINRRLAELLRPFGCRLTLFGRDTSDFELDSALASADVVVCAVADTPATRDVFHADRLARLPRRGLFVNVGRGSVVDERALVEALTDGRLGGAVIDVTMEEPLPPEHPFWSCPATIITQHTGGGTSDELDAKIDYFLDNLRSYLAGEPLRGVVDFKRGF